MINTKHVTKISQHNPMRVFAVDCLAIRT